MLGEMVEYINLAKKPYGDRVMQIKQLGFSLPTKTSTKRSNQPLDLQQEQVFNEVKTCLSHNTTAEAVNLLQAFQTIKTNNEIKSSPTQKGKHYINLSFINALVASIITQDQYGTIPTISKEFEDFKKSASHNLCNRLGEREVGDLGFRAGKNLSRPICLTTADQMKNYGNMSSLVLERNCHFKVSGLSGVEMDMSNIVLMEILKIEDEIDRRRGMIGFLESFV